MFLVTPVGEYMAHFKYTRKVDKRGRETWVTQCRFHKDRCKYVILDGQKVCTTLLLSVGMTRFNPIDRFSKPIARRWALSRSIANLPRATRAAIWEAYWLLTPRPEARNAS